MQTKVFIVALLLITALFCALAYAGVMGFYVIGGAKAWAIATILYTGCAAPFAWCVSLFWSK